MKEPQKIKLTDAPPSSKKVGLTPLPSLNSVYPEQMTDDIYQKLEENEDHKQNNSEIIQ
jgi:hypothetical protein